MGRTCAPSRKARALCKRRLSKKRLMAKLTESKLAASRIAPHQGQDSKANSAIRIGYDLQPKDPTNRCQDRQPERSTEARSCIEINSTNEVQQCASTNDSQQAEDTAVPHDLHEHEDQIEGRRIVDISYMLDQIHAKFDEHNHNPNLHCSFKDVIQTRSCRYGLQTQLFFKCRVCNFQDSVWTDRTDDDTMSINRCAVAGTMVTGIGYSQLQELLASISVPCMSSATYRKHDMEMVAAFEEASLNEMLEAGETAKNLAMENGDFIVHDGKKIPFVTVVADCAWAKRTYNTGKYDSLSGVGGIVDERTGKVLFHGVRNKFCSICEWATRHSVTTRPHVCFKNWGRDQASTGMEADILLDGFDSSMEMHGLIYKTLIADGDSNVYKSILANDPYGKYGIVVEKKECINHLQRNFCRKVRTVAKTKGRKISRLRKVVGCSVMKFRDSFEMAIRHRQNDVTNESDVRQQIRLLNDDILNAPYHVFGDHRRCNALKGFCSQQTTDEGLQLVDDLKKAGLFQQLEDAITYLAVHSDSLFYHANNNAAETFNSIVCKLIGGKRINFGMRGSFQGRCAGAVLQYNTQNVLTKLFESEGKTTPTTVTSLEARRQQKVINNAIIRRRTKLLRSLSPNNNPKHHGCDNSYGPNAEKPDMTEAVYDDFAYLHRNRMLENQSNRFEVEKNTRGQADNGLWRSARSKMLTASNFGRVCRMHDTTPCAATVKSILYPSVKSTPAMVWGRTNESKAVEALRQKLAEEGNATTIRPCGLFIDRDLAFLGASPDGIINDTTIVEVKCPKSVQNLHPEDAIQQRIGEVHKYFDSNDRTEMNKSHHYYYQVQGQLHITQADVCYFTVWTPLGVMYVKVPRDDEFWFQQMEPRLTRFYEQCLLPEIIDGRYPRKMPIREPEYILQARRMKIQTAEALQSKGQVRSRVIATADSAAVWANDDPYHENVCDTSADSIDMDHGVKTAKERKSQNCRERMKKVPPLKLIRSNQQDSESWSVTSSDDYFSETESTVPTIKLVKRRAYNGMYWAVSSSDEQSSPLTDKVRIPPLKLMKQRTELGHSWVISSADEQESNRDLQQLSAALPTAIITDEHTPHDRCSLTSLNEQVQTATKCSGKGDNGPWVVVSDDCFQQVPTETEIQVLESVNKNVPIADIRRDILSTNSLLNDTSIDQFLSVIRDRTNFNTETSLWLAYPRFIKPSGTSKDIYIIGGNAFRHWRCTHFDGKKLFVYDSLECKGYESLKAEEKRFISLRYPNLDIKDIIFPLTQKQPDNYSCGVFAAAFATTLALGGNPSNATYSRDVMELRNHLLQIIESKELLAFPSICN